VGIHNRVVSLFNILHPLSVLAYYIFFFCSVFIFQNPIFIITIFIASSLMAIFYSSLENYLKNIPWLLLLGLIVFLSNMLFVRRGSTILFYLFQNPVTKEALIYGVFNMFMIMSLLSSFMSFNALINSSRFLFLFSRLLPKTSFVLDMSLRYMPLLNKRASELAGLQRINNPSQTKGIKEKIKNSGNYLKTLTAWTLEEGMEGALSLRVKNYGTTKAVPYNRYRYTKKDFILISVFALASLGVLIGGFTKTIDFTFYPKSQNITLRGYDVWLYLAMCAFLFLPLLLEVLVIFKRKTIERWHRKND